MNREEWLTRVGEGLEKLFIQHGFRFRNKYRVTCGWPCRSAISLSRRRIGECHPPETSADKVSQVFISPVLATNDEVAGTLCHELIHVHVGNDAGHKGPFRSVCKHLGMKGRPTSATPGERLAEEIRDRILVPLGADYPHAAIVVPTRRVVKPEPKVDLHCSDCGCKIRISATDLERAGLPSCGCGSEFSLKDAD